MRGSFWKRCSMSHNVSSEARRPMKFFISQLLIMIGLAAVVSAAIPSRSEAAPPNPSLVISVPSQVRVNEPIVIDVTLRNAVDVAGYEMTWLYDPTAADVNRLRQRNNDVRRFGRDVNSLGPVERPDGVTIG